MSERPTLEDLVLATLVSILESQAELCPGKTYQNVLCSSIDIVC